MDAIFRIAISILQQSRIDLLQLDMEVREECSGNLNNLREF